MKVNRKLVRLWKSMRPSDRVELATALGTTVGYMKHIIEGRRPLSVEAAARVERFTFKTEDPIDRTELISTCKECSYVRIVRMTR